MLNENPIVLAMLVGDGYVDKKGRVSFQHSVVQRDYAEYKADLLRQEGFKVSCYSKKASGFSTNDSVIFYTTVTARGKRLRLYFYPNDKKKIPSEIFKRFGWKEWAIIYQDDGRQNKIAHYNTVIGGIRTRVECKSFVNRYEFCFPTFSDGEMKAAIASLLKLQVEARIGHHRKLGQRLLWISKVSAKSCFYNGIRGLIHESMSYKVSCWPRLKQCNTLEQEEMNYGYGINLCPIKTFSD